MKVFVDTNVILEFVMKREREATAIALVRNLQAQGAGLYMSAGGFYSMLYVVERYLKREGFEKVRRLEILRLTMENLLANFNVALHKKADLLSAMADESFVDLEDSCQYHAAVAEGCAYLVTFNIDDFQTADGAVKVITPEEYLMEAN